VVRAVHGQVRTWPASAREHGRPGAAPAHTSRHLSGDRPRLGGRIRPRKEPPT